LTELELAAELAAHRPGSQSNIVQAGSFDESLLILSDVHLGNDLNDLTTDGERRSAQVDVDLVDLLAHYRRAPRTGRRWRLIIAGDFIDFIGMALRPFDPSSEPNDEERAHGLGNTAEHARMKLRAAAARHRAVFEAIAAFVAEGHALTVVHGNHDIEFHWDAVKHELRGLLAQAAAAIADSAEPAPANGGRVEGETPFESRIDFAQWFYYVRDVAYVEHGHQYDTLCSTENVMAPLSPVDPRRITRSFSEILLRWVVRPTRGVPEYGHDRMGIVDYLRLAARLGVRDLVRLGARFASAIVELFRIRRAALSRAALAAREEHERRMAALAEATRVGIDRLRALAALQVAPVTRSGSKILASVLLDRALVACVAGATIGAIALVEGLNPWSLAAMGVVAAAWGISHRHLTRRRRAWFGERLDNGEALAERASHLARLFPAAFVVMGHTHMPAFVPVEGGATTYVNVGSWHEGESRSDRPVRQRAPRTHLVIHPADSGPTAEFLAWGAGGPRKFGQT
jgi:UDP-2,3-diacylglucosamine pyrophosphatase LpxH